MKTITSILLFLAFGLGITFSSAMQAAPGPFSEDDDQEIKKVNVFYFHMTRRCATCKAVESDTKMILKKLYPEMMESGQITFQSLNLEEESTDELAEANKVSGQALIFVSGDQKVDLTADGFMYAGENQDKLTEKIKATVDELLK